MTRYPYLLFDADNTLFDFDEANVSSFRAVCAYAGLALRRSCLPASTATTTPRGRASTAAS